MSEIISFQTDRLILRAPRREDAQAIFDGWASDLVATKYMGWPRHESIEDTFTFLDISDAEWEKWGIGPYLIELAETGEVIGSTGLTLGSSEQAMVGYILSPAHWGRGYATEVLRACIRLARGVGIQELYAPVHPDNHASQHILGKCDFTQKGSVSYVFPNLGSESINVPVFTLGLKG